MRFALTLAVALCAALPAAAQDDVPAPTESSPPPPPPEQSGYYQRCFGVPQVGVGPIGIYGEVEVPLGGGGRGGGGGAGGSGVSLSGSGDEKAWLLVAVIAVAALPVVIWAIDSPPPPVVALRYQCPTFKLEYFGGVQSSRDELGNQAHGVSTGRFSLGYGAVGGDLQFDVAPGAVGSLATHLIVRPPPKSHVEGGLAIGWRRTRFHGLSQEGLEIGLPNTYSFWRDGLRSVGLELRPMLLFSAQGAEPSLEAALLLPVLDVLHLRAGGSVFTFGGSLFWSVQGGLVLTL